MVGERLAEVRYEHKMSQKDIGVRLDISWRTYQSYEVGSREMSAEALMKFCGEFSIRPEWLLVGQGEKNKANDYESLADIVVAVENEITRVDKMISAEVKSNIIVKLFRKCNEGQPLQESDVADFVDLSTTGRDT
jgi:transcriptional regulator with XRE-family HTH domain